MTPGARIRAAAELLDRLDRPRAGENDLPADAMLNAYFRANRYIGAKDRRAVADAVFQTLRQRGFIDWWLARSAGLPVENRFRVLWTFNIHHNMPAGELLAACDGGQHRPAPLEPDQARRITLLEHGQAEGPEALADQASFPAWLTPEIERQFGADAWAEMLALTQPAPTDLRVNTLKADRETACAALAKAEVTTAPTPFSPLGLRLEGRANLPNVKAFRDGWIEIQDESSQLAALLVGAGPGMRVLDLCAGAGGKSLALAALMNNKGRIHAADTDAKRLARLAPRLARNGVRIVTPTKLEAAKGAVATGAVGGTALARLAAYDRVLIDAPCSGSGTWRRHPDAKWRLTPARLAGYRAVQAALLRQAAALVKPGGRMIYAVCSLLPAEGRDQVEAFAKDAGKSFRVLPADKVWRETIGGDAPFKGPFMLLTPHRHKTDGFFAAVLERKT